MDIDTYWEYSDPGASEARFREALGSAAGDERLELLTQVARSYSLRKRFDEANKVLDEIAPQVDSAGPRVKARYLLERGRTLNSSGRREEARPKFVEAWNVANGAGEEGLAVDAAHMVAITYSGGTNEALDWSAKGLALARGSKDPKAVSLVPALLNNSAWELYDMKRYDEALARFREAEREWTARGKPRQIHVAKWSVARCLRAMGRHDEALAILRGLQAEDQKAGTTDPEVAAEIDRNLAKDASA